MAEELRSPENTGPPTATLKGKVTRYNFANLPRNSSNASWTGQGGPTWFICLADASVTIRGNATPLKGVTQLGIRQRIGEIPSGGRPQSSGGSSGGQKSSGDVDIEAGRNQRGRVGGEQMGGGDGQGTRQAKTALQQPRLKRKRAQEETHSDKDGEIVDRGGGGRVRKRGGSDGGGADRRRKSAVVASEGAAAKSEGKASEDGLDDLDDDLDDLERELEGMDSEEDSFKIGRGQQTCEADEGESEAEDESEGDESDASIGAATLEIERFLEFVKGDTDGGDARVAKKRRTVAAGAYNLKIGNGTRSQVGASDEASEEDLASGDNGYGSGLRQGTMRPVHDKGTSRKRERDKGVGRDKDGQGSGGEGREDKRSEAEKRRAGRTNSVAPESLGCPQTNNEGQGKEGNVDSDLERDFDEMLEEDDRASDLDLDHEILRAKSKGNGEVREVERGSGASASGGEEELEDVSSYSEEESEDEDASEEDSASGDYGDGLRQGTIRPVHDKGTSRKRERDKGVSRDKDGQGGDGEGREDERSEAENRRAGGTNSEAPESLGCPQTNNEGQGEEEYVDSDLERDFDEMLEEDDGASDLYLDHDILRAKSKGNGGVREVERGPGVSASGGEEKEKDVSSYSEEESGGEDASEEDSVSGDYGNGLRQGTMRPVHDKGTSRKRERDKGVGRDKDGQGSDGEGKEDERSEPKKRRGGGTNSVTPEPLGCPQTNNEGQGEEENVDSDLERDFDEMLEEDDGASDLDLDHDILRAKSKGNGGVREVERGSGASASGDEEELEDVSSYSEEESGDEDASEEDSVSGDYGDELRQGTMRPVHVKGTSRKRERDKGVGSDKGGQGSDGEGREDERSEAESRRAGGTNSEAPEPLGCPQTNNEGQGEEEKVDSDLERDFDEMLEEDDGANDLDPDHDIFRAKSKGNGEVREVERGSGASASGGEEELEDVSSYSEEESGDEDAIEDIEDFLAQM